ncbi:DUF1214 domain-containing protein [Algiphilus sp.]|uniref:DUF1214 domain-containing protein n=1 Tax=Algiphilus sp. TaxID=1872431 RepID=UPI003B520E06
MSVDADHDVVSGEAWARFCDQLKAAGDQILRPETPLTPHDRAEGFRYLTRLLRIGLEMHLEFADPAFPGFFSPSHETAKIGADNPDNLYLMGRIDGRYDYIVEGDRGSVAYLSFGAQKGGYERDGKMTQTGFLDAADMAIDADGRFSIVLSQQQQSGNWVRLEPESNALIVRQTFNDRAAEAPARVTIRRADPNAAPEPLTAARLQQALSHTANFVEGTARLFADWAQSYQPHSNTLPPADQALCQSVGGDPNIVYYHSHWKLAEEEALVIHLPRIPDCRFWNLQINNYWMESLDYRYHRIHLNQHSAQVASDGSVTIVLAHRDPGHPNWLQTAGHTSGTLCLRWVGASEQVDPETEVVKLTALQQRVHTA